MPKQADPVPTFASEAEERAWWEGLVGGARQRRPCGLEPGAPGPLPQPEAQHHGHFAAPAGRPPGADHGGSQQAGRAVSVLDQDLAGGEGW